METIEVKTIINFHQALITLAREYDDNDKVEQARPMWRVVHSLRRAEQDLNSERERKANLRRQRKAAVSQ